MTEHPFRPNRPVRPDHQLCPRQRRGAGKLTDSVDISLDIRLEISARSKIGYIVIDDHVDLLDIDTSSDDIGSNEYLGLPVPERIENSITLVGHLVSVE